MRLSRTVRLSSKASSSALSKRTSNQLSIPRLMKSRENQYTMDTGTIASTTNITTKRRVSRTPVARLRYCRHNLTMLAPINTINRTNSETLITNNETYRRPNSSEFWVARPIRYKETSSRPNSRRIGTTPVLSRLIIATAMKPTRWRCANCSKNSRRPAWVPAKHPRQDWPASSRGIDLRD